MIRQPNAEPRSIRFRTGMGKYLTDEIVRIEALATKSVHDGISYRNVQTAVLALLKIAMV